MNTLIDQELLHSIWVCLVLAIGAASISITITQTELFVPLRAFTERLGHMTGYLFRCFYCMSHWVVIAGVAIYQPVVAQSSYWLVDLVVSAFFTITLSSFFSGLMFKVFQAAMGKKIKEIEVKTLMAAQVETVPAPVPDSAKAKA
ncbi:DUF1360 domain-containing protein [Vibrio fluvialis]|nr:DUF1360 domain-containing protein [Vibrio fluvialis]EKO3906969.1 DUF1360 domain-containing protein [Vibrio fluvialis]